MTGKSRIMELFLGVNLIWTANNSIKEYHLELLQLTSLELWKWTRTPDDWVSLADAPQTPSVTTVGLHTEEFGRGFMTS